MIKTALTVVVKTALTVADGQEFVRAFRKSGQLAVSCRGLHESYQSEIPHAGEVRYITGNSARSWEVRWPKREHSVCTPLQRDPVAVLQVFQLFPGSLLAQSSDGAGLCTDPTPAEGKQGRAQRRQTVSGHQNHGIPCWASWDPGRVTSARARHGGQQGAVCPGAGARAVAVWSIAVGAEGLQGAAGSTAALGTAGRARPKGRLVRTCLTSENMESVANRFPACVLQ